MVWRIVPRVEERSDYQRLEDNLLHRYDYEGFGKQTFLDRTGKNMTSMYHAAFAYLAELYRQKREPEKLDSLKAKFDDLWPEAGETVP